MIIYLFFALYQYIRVKPAGSVQQGRGVDNIIVRYFAHSVTSILTSQES